MIYGLGHKSDPAWFQPFHARALIAAHAEMGSPVLGRPGPFVKLVRNQGPTGSCEGQGWAVAIETCARAHGHDIEDVSEDALYKMARIREGQSPVHLVDEGTNGYSVASAIESRGVVSRARCPFYEATVNDPLPLDVWEHALDATLIGVGQLVGSDVDTLRACLDAGMPVTYAQVVDKQWDEYSGGVLGPYSDGNRGNHLTTLIDEDEVSFIGINSWGMSWGVPYRDFPGGFYRISPERLAQAFDFRVVNAGPAVLT